jgi:hypothetical protein
MNVRVVVDVKAWSGETQKKTNPYICTYSTYRLATDLIFAKAFSTL